MKWNTAEKDLDGIKKKNRKNIGNDIDFILDCAQESRSSEDSVLNVIREGWKKNGVCDSAFCCCYIYIYRPTAGHWPPLYILNGCVRERDGEDPSPCTTNRVSVQLTNVTRYKWMYVHSHFKEIGFHSAYTRSHFWTPLTRPPLTLSVWLCSFPNWTCVRIVFFSGKIEVDISVCVCRRLIDIGSVCNLM